MINKRKIEKALRELEPVVKKGTLETIKQLLCDLWDNVLDFLYNSWYRFVKRPISKTIKVFQLIPVIWQDEDWDFDYLLNVIRVKILRMKKCILDENILSKEVLEEIASSIDEVCEHMDNFVNNYEVYNKKHPLPFNIKHVTIPTEDGKGYYLVTYNADKDRPLTKTEDAIYGRHLRGMTRFEEKEWNAIWDTIKEHGRFWWD